MGISDFFSSPVRELYIARPPEAADHLIYLHPDRTIPRGAKLKVRSDEICVFFRNGRVVGTLQPGDHLLDSGNMAFLNEIVVNKLTGGNHYLAELFFVRRAEHLQKSGDRSVGQHTDRASGHFVTLLYNIQFGVKVTDPAALITRLGGMEARSAERVGEFLIGRIESHLRAAVGLIMQQSSAMDVVSNQYNERIGQEVQKLCANSFSSQGLELVRFVRLTLKLDEESTKALRQFGSERAGLTIQREGSLIANNPGFSNYHIAQGQRSALEGLGEGMATGGNSSPILGVGIGLGMGGSAPMTSGVGYAPQMQPTRTTNSILSKSSSASRSTATMRWYLRTQVGTEGPYTIRQLVLRFLAEGESLDTATVRADNDPNWFPAHEEEAIRKEFERRQSTRRRNKTPPSESRSTNASPDAFEKLFLIAVEDRLLTRDEINMLAPMAIASGIAQTIAEAQKIVVTRAIAYGCEIDPDFEAEIVANETAGSTSAAPPPPRPTTGAPPPPRPTLYAYDNGRKTLHDQTANQVVEQMRSDPSANHLVWRPGFSGWISATDIDEISKLLGATEE